MELGILQWFHFNDREQALRALDDLQRLGITELRTGVSWADWCRPDAAAWFDWLLPLLCERLHVLPCLTYTPPSLGRKRKTNSPPRRLDRYAQFTDEVLQQYGAFFTHVELWNEPNNDTEWNSKEDPQYALFAQMVAQAAEVVHRHGKSVVLGGMCNCDAGWLARVAGHGLLGCVDVVGVHCFPGTWDPATPGWEERIKAVQGVLDEHGSRASIWITEVGSSTLHGDQRQMRTFHDALTAPVERVYWYSLYDLHPSRVTVRGATTGYNDRHEYHMGIKRADGTPKPLFALWESVGVKYIDA